MPPTAPALDWKWTGLAAALLAMAIAAAYANSLDADYVLDNSAIVRDDPRMSVINRQSLHKVFTEGYWWPYLNSDLYRPLTTLSFQLNARIAGPERSPTSYHLANLLLHWMNSVLIVCVARRFLPAWAAVAAAVVFAVHPLAVESVTNLVGRCDLLSTLMVLTGMLCHIRRREGGGAGWLALLGLAATAGVFCKESAAAMLGMLIAWDWAAGRADAPGPPPGALDPRPWIRHARWDCYLAIVPSLALLYAARVWLFGLSPFVSQSGVDNPLVMADAPARIVTAASVLGRYVGLWLWPRHLSCDYSFDQIAVWTWRLNDARQWATLGWLGVFLAACVAALLLGRRRPFVLFLAGAAAAVMLPTSNLLFPIGTIMAERFMYLPSACLAGIVLIGVMGVASRPSPRWIRPLAAAAAVIVVAGLSMRTVARNRDWKDEWTLWSAAMRVCPDSFKVYQGMASALPARDGLRNSADRMAELLLRSRSIIEVDRLPIIHRPMPTYSLLAQAYAQKGDTASLDAGHVPPHPNTAGQPWYLLGIQSCELGLEVDAAMNRQSRQSRLDRGVAPERLYDVGYYPLHITYSVLLERAGRPDEALAAIDRARALSAGNSEAHQIAAEMLERQGRLEPSAIRGWQAALTRPSPLVWQHLQRVYARLAPDAPLVLFEGQKPAMNKGDPRLNAHVAVAVEDLVDLCLRGGAPDVAAGVVDIAERDMGQDVRAVRRRIAEHQARR
jgi:hypothetical protein